MNTYDSLRLVHDHHASLRREATIRSITRSARGEHGTPSGPEIGGIRWANTAHRVGPLTHSQR